VVGDVIVRWWANSLRSRATTVAITSSRRERCAPMVIKHAEAISGEIVAR